MSSSGTAAGVADQIARHGFVAPDYTGRSLAAVLPAAAGALQTPEPTGDFERARRLLGLDTADRVCVVLVDGLGFENLRERSGHAPFLRSLLDEDAQLTCGFPSTTAASIGILGTGSCPGRTGMLGYTVREPSTGGLANLVSWEGATEPTTMQREETVFERMSAAGRSVTSVGPSRFAQSGLTQAALRGGFHRGAESLADRVDVTAYELMAPGLVYLYWGDVDKIGHHHGSESRAWGDELERTDRELARLARVLPRGTQIIVTADHGMIDVDRARRWDVAATQGLAEGVKLVAGEPRAVHVHARKPEGVAGIVDRWRDVLGDGALVAPKDEIIEAGLLGPVSDHVYPYIGDVVVAVTGRGTIVDSRTQTARSLDLVGVHGSLTPREMRVPFLTLTV
ncbi:alkaline phosphatase family protein [Sanguibacter antarcticus]|uniref:Type I phosphodiesterase/nucleotide pyrophosphatase n=1 Tax=Sanguibacter antarcticus TaxID=372484 RepID=A0A2A9E270_9MICO|nr:type I phosphodiesterase/nucleotide pyrophosphatase [Sanguibacter antarcticus]